MFVTPNGEFVVIPWRPDMAQLVPHAREFSFKGERMLLVPNGRDEAKVARNLGVMVPAPIVTRYSWPHLPHKPPWDTQKLTASLLTESRRAYVLSTMGTGKTAASIWAADYLRHTHKIGPVLVSAPLSTLTPVWEKELFELLPQARVRVLHGSREKRLKLLAEDADWYVINHHGLEVLRDDLVARGFGICILDELSSKGLRTKSTELWKAAATVVAAPSLKYVWGMTGTPRPKAPTDVWAQVKLLTPDRTTRTLGKFRDLTMRQVSNFKWIERAEANAIVFDAMQPSIRYTIDDVQELPPTSYINREVKLEPETAHAYKLLFDKMVMMSKHGLITAANEGVLQTKLLQVACGYIYADNHKVYELPNDNRMQALLELVTEADRKVIVFVPFVHALQGVTNFLRDKGEKVELVFGGTARGRRDKIFRAFQDDPTGPRVLVAHPECMAHGLTLTAANVIVWYGPTTLEFYEQANARIVRPSQTAKTLIFHLVGTPVEKAAYARLRDRAQRQGMLLELFENQDLEF